MLREPPTAEVVKLELKCRIVGVFPDSATWWQLTKGGCLKLFWGVMSQIQQVFDWGLLRDENGLLFTVKFGESWS